MGIVEKSELEKESEGELRELVHEYHKKGLKYTQLWQMVHDLEAEITTQLIAEAYCNGTK